MGGVQCLSSEFSVHPMSAVGAVAMTEVPRSEYPFGSNPGLVGSWVVEWWGGVRRVVRYRMELSADANRARKNQKKKIAGLLFLANTTTPGMKLVPVLANGNGNTCTACMLGVGA